MGFDAWPDTPSNWIGQGGFLARTDGMRNLLFTGEVPRIDLAYIEQMIAGQNNGFSRAAYLQGGRGPLRAGGSHYAAFEVRIPFMVSRDVPAVLALSQSTHYTVTTNGYPFIALEQIPPATLARIERWDPNRQIWERVAIVFHRARLDSFPSPGRYLDLGHLRTTVSLEAGVQYRLVVWLVGHAEFIGSSGDASVITTAFGGGVGSSILLLANRSTVPLPETVNVIDLIRTDINADGMIDDTDLLAILISFGNTGSHLPEDVNVDGIVDDGDFLEVLARFGFSY